jgi:hypothetical protein
VPLANAAASVRMWIVRPLSTDRLARRREDSTPTVDPGLSGPRSRTVHAATESTAASTPRSDWHPDQRQHAFWQLR